jgi:hypothetical protein
MQNVLLKKLIVAQLIKIFLSTPFANSLNVQYHIHKSPPLDPVMFQMKSVHISTSYYLKTNSSINPLKPKLV